MSLIKEKRYIYYSVIIISTISLVVVYLCNRNIRKELPNVIILTLSGVRNSDSIDDPTHQYIPNLWFKLFKDGVVYDNLIDRNYEFHMPVVHMINTGLYYPYIARIRAPSIFQYVRKRYHLPATKLWLIDGWLLKSDGVFKTREYGDDTYCEFASMAQFTKINMELKRILSDQELAFGKEYEDVLAPRTPKWPHWEASSKITFLFFKRILLNYKPKLVHYIMNGPETAHYDSYGKYVQLLLETDKMIKEIIDLINNTSFYKNNTYLIISVDHSRNDYYMDHTIHSPDNPSRVWMFIYGPNVKKGIRIKREVSHADIFATVAYLMNVTTHPNEGKVLSDCFLQ